MRHCIVILLLLLTAVAHAQTDTLVAPNPAYHDDTITLTLRSDHRQGRPDFSALEADFEIVNIQSSARTSNINGESSTTYQHQVSLTPRRTGRLTIPSIAVGNDRSREIRLPVRKRPPPDPNAENRELYMEMELEPRELYVGQQAILTQRLHVRVPLVSGDLAAPIVEGAVIERAGEDSQYTDATPTHNYTVIERRYVIFPEQVGTLRVGDGLFSGKIEVGSAPTQFSMFRRTKTARAGAEGFEFEVKPPPSEVRGHWLPATNLTVSADILPEGAELRVGEPVTLRLRITAEGQLGSALPEISIGESDRFSAYAEPGSQDTSSNRSGVTGVRELNVALIPRKAGKMNLASISVPWWDVVSQQAKIATVASQTLTVLPALPVPGETPVHVLDVPNETAPVTPASKPTSLLPWVLSALFALLWLLTTGLWLRARQASGPVVVKAEPIKALSVSDSGLAKAIRLADAATAAKAVCEWLGQQVGQNIGAVPQAAAIAKGYASDAASGEQLANELMKLDAARFASGDLVWDGQALLNACEKWAIKMPEQDAKQRLPGLYSH